MPLVQSLLATSANGNQLETSRREVRSGSCVAQSGTTAHYKIPNVQKSNEGSCAGSQISKEAKFHIGKYPQCHVNHYCLPCNVFTKINEQQGTNICSDIGGLFVDFKLI